MKIVSSAKMSEKHQLNLREKYPEVDFYFFDNIDQAFDELSSADVLITYGEDLTEEIMKNCIHLKWIHVLSAGLNKIPFKVLKEKGIVLTNARGIHHIPMSEYTMGVILQLARKTIDIYKNQLAKKWDRTIRVSEINGKTLGIIGLGSIGKGIAEKAKAFDMKVIGMNTDGKYVPNVDQVFKHEQLHDLLAESDYVVVIVPLTEKTYHLIGEQEFKAMKNTAYFINISRGDVIDELAIINALENGEIAGAVLDVFSEEPLPTDHPLWSLENCFITPHLSGRSPKYMERALEIFINNLNKYIEDNYSTMENLIDLDKGY
ncbi:hydroxyacid dehydrogenase [Vulcanibacillus modesticaldus]|uniref:Hydroxyacid dehydrogenase n=1 Tax=Vulcanibacillus modesticaldus TaxID=337097 RepID=A0A1D2YSY8_9BACI|nr:D-2-hydroxyacid dehydrogenase [Vulcanibacillus modesticaldus]OEF98803.1 hydroxyacid dehydrogenase [Vulcanibacillus modesticaldus]